MTEVNERLLDSIRTKLAPIRGQPQFNGPPSYMRNKLDLPTLPASRGHLHACLSVHGDARQHYTINILGPATFPSVFSKIMLSSHSNP
jgi:hypothetical protein